MSDSYKVKVNDSLFDFDKNKFRASINMDTNTFHVLHEKQTLQSGDSLI
jgi:hypothetical protein